MRYLIFLAICCASIMGHAQDREIDQLEVLYDQGYYSKVWHKSAKLMAMPEYDYSGLPSFYKALSLFRLSNDEAWFKRHNNAVDDAISSYKTFMESDQIVDYLNAHYLEIASLKTYLVELETKFEGLRHTAQAAQIQDFRLNELKSIKSRPDIIQDKTSNGGLTAKNKDKSADKNKAKDDKTASNKEDDYSSFRQKMVVYAKSLVGVKYKWAGNSPDGFDCSGFVGYVFQKYGFALPRSASDQLAQAKKLKLDEAFMGDLVFFASGSTISHVGLVISEKGKDLMMVHSSTSKGVIITDIPSSSYWQGKLKAAGTYL